MFRVIDCGTILSPEKGTDRQSLAFPGICVLPSGRWICALRAAPIKADMAGQHVLLAWSDDEGHSWSVPRRPFAPVTVGGKLGLLRGAYLTALGGRRVLASLMWVDHSDPSLPFFNEETEGLLDTRIFFAISDDEGFTWSKLELMDTSPFDVPTPLTGPTLLLPGGQWACQFELNKHCYDTTPWRHSAVLKFSHDQGRSWPDHAIAGHDPEDRIFYWDQRPGLLMDGAILDVFWTYDTASSRYLNMHARESHDLGRTWSEIWDTGVSGQAAQPVSIPGGRVALAYVERTGLPSIRIRSSADGGRTWPDDTLTILYELGDSQQSVHKSSMNEAWEEMFAFSVGLPATASLPGGDVLVVYYAGPSADFTAVEWVRVRAE